MAEGMVNEKAQKVFALKYSTRKTPTWKQKCREIARMMAQGVSEKEDEYYESIMNLFIIPGGRIIANAGTDIKNLANCFVLPIEDSRKGIYQTLQEAAEVFAMGGGTGFSFSNIREEGALIKSTGGKASGPLGFMTIFDQTGEIISQASRRGAQIGTMKIDHPDIEKFIHFKSTPDAKNKRLVAEYLRNSGEEENLVLEKTLIDNQLSHFNISVLLTDEFMKAVENDEDWNLVSPSTKEIVKTLKAKKLLESIAKQAWASADPGILMYSRINEDNIVDYIENIEATNPCGEVPLLSYESCILASINLHRMYDSQINDIDWELLKNTTKTMTRFLHDVTKVTEAPVNKINMTTQALRRLGGGVLGFSDLLIEMDIPYDSDECEKLSDKLSWFISFHSWETSVEIAKEEGHFEWFDYDKANLSCVRKTLFESEYGQSQYSETDLMKYGIANNGVNSVAPTGSIAILAGVNGSIEPFFALCYKRNITEGVGNIAKDTIYEINPALEKKLNDSGYSKDEITNIMEYVSNTGSLKDCPNVSKKLQNLFKTADEIDWKRHIQVQASWQHWFSNAISKTINMPEDTTWQNIYDAYLYMWKVGLKGGTIYRNNSKSFQILEKPVKKENK